MWRGKGGLFPELAGHGAFDAEECAAEGFYIGVAYHFSHAAHGIRFIVQQIKRVLDARVVDEVEQPIDSIGVVKPS